MMKLALKLTKPLVLRTSCMTSTKIPGLRRFSNNFSCLNSLSGSSLFSAFHFSFPFSTLTKPEQLKSYDELLEEHQFHKKVTELSSMKDPEIVSLIEKLANLKTTDPKHLRQYGQIAIETLSKNGSIPSALICGLNVVKFLELKNKNDVYLCEYYGIMSELHNILGKEGQNSSENVTKSWEYLQKSEDLFLRNQENLSKEQNYTISEMLSVRNLEAGRIEKCIEYASKCIQNESVIALQKVNSVLTLIDCLTNLNKQQEATIIGERYIFQEIADLDQIKELMNEQQIESLLIILERLATLRIENNELTQGLVLQEVLQGIMALTEGRESWKYACVESWRRDNLYGITLQEGISENQLETQLKDAFSQAESIMSKLIKSSDQVVTSSADTLKPADSIPKRVAAILKKSQFLKKALAIHKEIFMLSKQLEQTSNLSEEQENKYRQLCLEGLSMNEELQGMPFVDTQFIKTTFYGDQKRLTEHTQKLINKVLHANHVFKQTQNNE